MQWDITPKRFHGDDQALFIFIREISAIKLNP